jgi:phosphatidylserine/phosphatidylglycerophosphate/cardiolipin synthase-like enzyme
MKKLSVIGLTAILLSGCSISTLTAPTNTPPAKEVQPTPTPAPTPKISDVIQYSFTQANQHPEKMMEDVINNAKSSLDIAIYSLTKKDIVDSIAAAKDRGVQVRLITDQTEAKSKSQSAMLKQLKGLGILIKQNVHSGLMHLKVTIADKAIATTGSYNYSQAASTTNDEVLVVIRDQTIATDFEAQFERMWNNTKGFVDYK